MENIGKIYYINLDHRTDRNEQFLSEMNKLGISSDKVERISGIYNKEIGAVGCGKSHIKTLETFLASSYETCLIFEDDFQFTLDINYVKFLLRTLFEDKIAFDLVMVSGNIFKVGTSPVPYLQQVLDGQTVSGILVTRQFAPTLLACFKEAIQELEKWFVLYKERKHEYCIDIYWKKLQPTSRWFIFKPKFGIQRESYSDNEYRVANYGM